MRQEVIDYIKKIKAMRSAQKRYFRSKNNESLIEAKRLETAVDSSIDSLIHRLENPTKP